MSDHYPPPYFATSRYEAVFDVAREKCGSTLHDIVKARETYHDDDILQILDSVVAWKLEKGLALGVPDGMVAASRELHGTVNSAGFWKYFETDAGNHWQHVRDVLRLGGDVVGLRAFLNVLALFPNGEPAPHRERRMDEVDAINRTDPDAFRKHDRIRDPMNYPSDDTILRAMLALPDQRYVPDML